VKTTTKTEITLKNLRRATTNKEAFAKKIQAKKNGTLKLDPS
jgi:hypothetical protein